MTRIKTLETYNALPYISAFTITKIPTQKWEPTGQVNQQGQELYRSNYDRPGIQVEITTYMGNIKGPSKPYEFPLRSFYEGIIAELQAVISARDTLTAKENRTVEENQQLAALNQQISSQKIVEKIAQVEAIVSDTSIIWAESVLLAAGIPNFDDFWDEVVSDGLDLFPSWEEANRPLTGIPVYLKEMQIKANIPYEGNKIVAVKMGSYLDPAEELTQTVHELVFEDTASRTQRENQLSQYQTALTSRQEQLESTPEEQTEQRQQIQADIDNITREIARLEALEIGLLSDLLATPAIQTTLPTFLLSVIGVLKAAHWPTLDMTEVQTRLQQNLLEMMTSLNVPSATSDSGSKPNS